MGAAELYAHLAGGLTTVVRCWALTRRDGLRLGFTDHDRALSFDGLEFRADSGLSAKAVQQATGLSVDNSEAMGALSDASLSEADIEAGRFDDAELVAWLVNWIDVSQRRILFRGTLGQIRRGPSAFHAELRGLTERLNRPMGRVYHKSCAAVLGDAACKFDLKTAGYLAEKDIVFVDGSQSLSVAPLPGFELGWFSRGRLEMLSGAAAGLSGGIKRDRHIDGLRVIDLWEPLRAPLAPGDRVRLTAGCDKMFETCRFKFNNIINFQGFPDVPEEDWMLTHASSASVTDGGSRR
ncbi:DUF2163 domain-containing protein [Salipiger sp. PrR002]|uniref:DUF2163 domain-containing protein n=1 Tax=Salipiger sp. PrR002 TaxID=2706489 RepID=UPI0013BB7C05|nr:DUF2163 domain-containing protein [Salipiger sp. PrR002]NDV99533.1 DUF2163 domain-containing protein [Salipiger sp. PrR002]NDW57179.1 DUF2163 domain-containing protein [Salipiger sp. PrR004]